MRRRLLFCVLMTVLCLFFASCGRQKTIDDAERIAKLYAELENASMQATIQADFGDRVSVFTLRFDYARDAVSTIEILAPEEVKGIKATIEAGQTELAYDGLMLETGPLPGTGLTPVDALPVIVQTWGHGYMSSTGVEKIDGVSYVRIVYKSTVSGVEVEHSAWFDQRTYQPLKAETMANGARVITCTFDTFTMGE